jgi:hypothetical protein
MSRARQRVRLERGLKLDLNWMIRKRLARPGKRCSCTIDWHGVAGHLTTDLTGERRGYIRLQIGDLDQSIGLEAAPRHFGGYQWYFVCPATRRRASVLWLPPGARHFASRQAWGRQVAYASQFQPAYIRVEAQFDKLVCRLGGSDFRSKDGSLPRKPKGMHWRKYEAELDRCEALRNKENFHWASVITKAFR